MRVTCGSNFCNRGDSFRLPGAAIADSDNFISLEVFVPAKAEIIATFLGCGRCPIPVNNADVEQLLRSEDETRNLRIWHRSNPELESAEKPNVSENR
jgi:hypothetical protein